MAEEWYRITDWSDDVETATVESATDKTVLVGGRRRRMTSSWECYRRTSRECIEWLVESRAEKLRDAQSRYDSARESMEQREEELCKAMELLAKEPPP